MDHRDLYKSTSNNGIRQAKARAIVERRQQQRHDIHATQRCISEEPTDAPPAQPVISTVGPATAFTATMSTSTAAKLTKQQLHQLKFLAWREKKVQDKLTASAIRRPFTAAVPAKRFVSPQAGTIPRSQQFRPPANLPALTLAAFGAAGKPLNNPIVTRSMARQQQQQLAKATKPAPAPVVRKPMHVFKAPAVIAAVTRPFTRPAAPKLPNVAAGRLRANTAKNQQNPAKPKPTTSKAPTVATLAVPPPLHAVADGDITAVGATFSADGSMITSTAQKLHTKRGCTPDPMLLDMFSPIEPDAAAAGSAASGVHAQRKSAHKRSMQAKQSSLGAEAAAVDLNVTPVRSSVSEEEGATGSAELQRSINYVSPYVSTARGKVSARKERKQRDSMYKLDLNQSLEECPEARQRREAARYFRQQLADEAQRLATLAADWQAYKEQHAATLQSCYVDLIDVTTGQTRLLLAKKFQQFGGLIDQCESGGGEQPVLAPDLEGFWSMVYMQVENCNARFERLDQLRSGEWSEETVGLGGISTTVAVESSMAAPRPVMAAARKKPKPKVPRTGNPFLEQIKKASRQRLLEQKQQDEANGSTTAAPAAKAVTIERKTPRKSMLASVLCHEAHKSIRVGGASPRKSLAPVLVSSSSALNTRGTATRSILKTPATRRAPRRGGVAFAVSDEAADCSTGTSQSPNTSASTPPRQKARNALKFVCTPMRKSGSGDGSSDEEHDDDENDIPRDHCRRVERRQSFCVTPTRETAAAAGVAPIQRAAERFSLLDSPVVNFNRMTLTEAGPSSRQRH